VDGRTEERSSSYSLFAYDVSKLEWRHHLKLECFAVVIIELFGEMQVILTDARMTFRHSCVC